MGPSFRPLDDPSNRIDAIEEPMRRKLAAIVIGAFLLLALAAWAITPKHTPWRIGSDGVHVDGLFWRGFAAASDIDFAHLQVVDFERTAEWRPAAKEFGYDGFGYKAGSFVLKNGQHVELYLAHETTGVLLPRRSTRPLLIGVSDPQAFLAQAQAAWPAKP